MPRGYKRECIPGWNERSEELYRDFQESGDNEIIDELLPAARREKWMKAIKNIDFTTLSRKMKLK